MSKRTITKLLFVAVAIAALAVNTGCFTSVAGPEPQPTVESKVTYQLVASKPRNADVNGDGTVDVLDLEIFDEVVRRDVNGDKWVDQADLQAISAAFGQSGSGLAADINGDGTVTFSDFVAWASYEPYFEAADVESNGQLNRGDRMAILHEIEESF